MTRQDSAADIMYHVIALSKANDPLSRKKGSNLLQKNGKTLEIKGMEVIIRERGLWLVKGMNAQCDGFKCVAAGKTDCSSCCCRLLFTQPDFVDQKSHLEELITSRGHICDFYPKYHCELKFIEQYWGAAKLRYRNSPKTSDINEMEANIKASLDSVPLLQIQRCVHMIL